MNAAKCLQVTGSLLFLHTQRISVGKAVFSLLSMEEIKTYFPDKNCVGVWDPLKNTMSSFTMTTKESEMKFSSYSCSWFSSCGICKIALLSKSTGFLHHYSESLGSNSGRCILCYPKLFGPWVQKLSLATMDILRFPALKRLIFLTGASLWDIHTTTRWQ